MLSINQQTKLIISILATMAFFPLGIFLLLYWQFITLLWIKTVLGKILLGLIVIFGSALVFHVFMFIVGIR